jgi:fructooligosaccharide transport system substrate-binding protein
VAACGSWCWGIASTCDDVEAAGIVLTWLLDTRHGIKPIVEANGAVPGRHSAFALFPEYEEMPRRLFRAQLQASAHPRPRTGVYLTLTSEFARALRDIALGADVKERLGEAARAVQRVLDRRHADDSE